MMSKLRKGFVAAVVMAGAIGVGASSAFAQTATPPDPEAEVTSLVTEGTSQIAPIMVALFGAVLVLAVLTWGLNKAYKAVKSGGRVSV